MIAFIGSVFSPYYACARARRGGADPLNHCAVNVALYGGSTRRWAMTERSSARTHREASLLSIGPSTLRWNAHGLDIEVDEVCVPLPRRVRGLIRLRPAALNDHSFDLDPHGRHRWTPIAPHSRIEIRLSHPALHWDGNAYFDSNSGDEPLERAFRSWTWSRARLPDGTVVMYDIDARTAPRRTLALQFSAAGAVEEIPAPPQVQLKTTGWRMSRATRSEPGGAARVIQTLEDAPFYSRSLLQTRILGRTVTAFHESLSLDRFRSRWVQSLLPFRMPRTN